MGATNFVFQQPAPPRRGAAKKMIAALAVALSFTPRSAVAASVIDRAIFSPRSSVRRWPDLPHRAAFHSSGAGSAGGGRRRPCRRSRGRRTTAPLLASSGPPPSSPVPDFGPNEDDAWPDRNDAAADDGEGRYIWDGVPIEGAHDDEFDDIEDPGDPFVPSPGFMSGVASMPSALDVVGTARRAAAEDPSDVVTGGFGLEAEEWEGRAAPSQSFGDGMPAAFLGMGGLHRRAASAEGGSGLDFDEEEVLELGGDPFFLQGADGDDGGDVDQVDVTDDGVWGWDGTVDEDAHLDFD